MIKLSSQEYKLENINLEDFWKYFDSITVGQYINPEISYTTQYWGNFDNIFGGRRKGNTFSVFLYRPVTSGFRTEILAKGVVNEKDEGLIIACKFEIPLWSIFMLIFFGALFSLPLFALSLSAGLISSFFFLLVYILIIKSNHADVKEELNTQVKIIKRTI